MSNTHRMVCISHTPNLRSDECGTNLERIRELARERGKVVEALKALDQAGLDSWNVAERDEQTALNFLREHPYCELVAIDERGGRFPLGGTPAQAEPVAIGRDASL